MAVRPKETRSGRQEWEAAYVSEFIAKYFPGRRFDTYVRLGSYPQPVSEERLEEPELALLRVRMRWADAVVYPPPDLIVVEGKLRPTEYLKGLSELELYLRLVPNTPHLQIYLPVAIRGILLTPIEDPALALLAREKGFQYLVFVPSFWPEYARKIGYAKIQTLRYE